MHRFPRISRTTIPTLGLMVAAACADQPSTLEMPTGPSLAKTPAARYQLRFVVTDAETMGEITSTQLFPAGGVTLNTNDPWRQMSASGGLVTLTSPTHGVWSDGSSTYAGTCRRMAGRNEVIVDWTIAGTNPERTFAGDWLMNVSTSRDRSGTVSFYLAGPRVKGGVASESYGNIRNIASNGNAATETKAADGSWFAIEFKNALLGFGSLSTPDGNGTLSLLDGYETACANFKLEAVRM